MVSALLAALFARERTGKGQAVEVPMFETLVSFVMVEHLYGETFMPALDTAGYKRVLNKERRPYPSKDGYFALLPYTDGHWKEFCVLVGRDDLAKDPRFQGMANRLKNVEQYYATLAGLCAERTNAEWVELLKNSNVPHGPVNTLDDLFVDPQLEATGYWQEVDHPTRGQAAHAGHRAALQQDQAGDHAPAAAARRAQRRGAARGGLQPGGNRRHAEIGRDQDGVNARKSERRYRLARGASREREDDAHPKTIP